MKVKAIELIYNAMDISSRIANNAKVYLFFSKKKEYHTIIFDWTAKQPYSNSFNYKGEDVGRVGKLFHENIKVPAHTFNYFRIFVCENYDEAHSLMVQLINGEDPGLRRVYG